MMNKWTNYNGKRQKAEIIPRKHETLNQCWVNVGPDSRDKKKTKSVEGLNQSVNDKD